jgi:hypothetical protein
MMKTNKLVYESPKIETVEVRIEGVICESGFDRSDYGNMRPFSAPVFPDESLF